MLEILNNDDFDPSNNNDLLPKKDNSKRNKRIATIIISFTLAVIVLIGATQSLLQTFDQTYRQVADLLQHLNHPYQDSDVIGRPITVDDYSAFANKARDSGFDIFVDGQIDLWREQIGLEQEMFLLDSEFGAYINKAFESNESANSLLTARELTITQPEGYNSGEYVLKVVVELNLQFVMDFISQYSTGFPTKILVTTTSDFSLDESISTVMVGIKNTTYKINNLQGEVNAKLATLINQVFSDNSSGQEFLSLMTDMVALQLLNIAEKTNSDIICQSTTVGGQQRFGIRFIPLKTTEE